MTKVTGLRPLKRMNVNVLKQELHMSFRSWFWYTFSLLAMMFVFGGFFNFFKEDAALIDELLKNFPMEFRAAFGFADVNLSVVDGFFSFIFSYITLIGAIFGMKLGVGTLSEESRRKTTDFLLAKPIKRHEIVTAKLCSILVQLLTQNVLLFLLGAAVLRLITGESMDMGLFAAMSFSVFLVQLFFVGIGLVLAAQLDKIKSVMPLTLGVVFLFFIIELLNASLMEKALTFISPFSYFKGSDLLQNHGYDMLYVIIDLAVFILFTALSYWIYAKKDIHAV